MYNSSVPPRLWRPPFYAAAVSAAADRRSRRHRARVTQTFDWRPRPIARRPVIRLISILAAEILRYPNNANENVRARARGSVLLRLIETCAREIRNELRRRPSLKLYGTFTTRTFPLATNRENVKPLISITVHTLLEYTCVTTRVKDLKSNINEK